MSEEYVIIPSHEKDYSEITDSVELSRTKPLGKLFRKHLLNKGPLLHPRTKKTINIDDNFFAKLQDNFHSGVCDIVQVPLANDRNEHTEDPLRNLGEVVDLQVENDKLYAVIDVRDEAAAKKMGRTLLGASALMDLDYTDTRDGIRKGPTLLHACVTNRPYVVGLEDYQEIVAATADNKDSVVLLSAPKVDEENTKPEKETTKEIEMPEATYDELVKRLKDEFGVDIPALQAEASKKDEKEKELADAAALTNTLTEEATSSAERVKELEKTLGELQNQLSDAGVLKLTNGETLTTEDLFAATAQLSSGYLELSNQVNELRTDKAKAEVEKDVEEGFFFPSQAEAMTEIKLSNPSLYERLKPAKPVVSMKEETGVVPEDVDQELNVDDYITELSNSHPEFFRK